MASSSSKKQTVLGAGAVFRRVLGYWRPHWRTGMLLLGVLTVAQLYTTFFAYSLKLIIDHAIGRRDGTFLAWLLVALGVGFLLSAAATLWAEYLTARIGAAILNRLRQRMFDHLQRLSMGYYAHASTGDLVARFSSDIGDIEKAATTRTIDAFFATVGLLINVPILIYLDWRLAGAMVLGMPAVWIGSRLFSRRAAESRYQLKKDEAAVASAVSENVQAQAVVKVFGLQQRTAAEFGERLGQLERSHVRASFAKQLVASTSSLGVLFVQILVIAVGGYLAFSGRMSLGALVAFITLHGVVAKLAYELTKKVVPAMLSASGGVLRIEELLEETPQVQDAPDAAELEGAASDVELDHVCFGYTPERLVLDDVTLSIPAGSSVALVGPSGSGKSSVLNLIMRFYDPSEGSVRTQGHDLRKLQHASLLSKIGAVFQDTYLYDTTIRENIRLGRVDATDDEVEAAARAAEIHDLIASMPAAYDTLVGEGGGRLSGQRQRIAIARAILRNPDILVLDEATSALDPGTEAALNKTLAHLAEDRSVIAVTHRLASARTADWIFVFDAGRLVEQGSHDELLAAGGLYHDLWEKQSSVEVSDDGRTASVQPERLRTVPLFAELEDSLLESIAADMLLERFDAHRSVFEEEDVGDKFYVIARGKVEVVDVDEVLEDRRVAVISDGDFFGEIALLHDVPRSASVRTLTPCFFLTLTHRQFDDLMEHSPALKTAVDAIVKRRQDEFGGEAG